jgi:hypothetical protein
MTAELLSESFCERCGTRYELGSSEPMTRKQKTRGLVTGLRQFIMSTDSLSDSISDAMQVEEEQLAARQIDAFQEAFSFCFDCRRYTCLNCWNDDAGRCRSCVPVPGVDDLVAYDDRVAGPALVPDPVDETPLLTTAQEPTWPAEGTPAMEWPSEDEIVTPVAAEAEIAEPIAAEAEPPEPVEETEPIAAAAEMEPEAPEVVPGFAAAEAETAEPVEEPIAAAAELEPEPEIPLSPPPPPPVAAPRRDLRDTFARGPVAPRPTPASAEPPESLAARRSQLESLGIDDPGEGTVSVGAREALPYRSSGAGSVAYSSALSALWDASTRNLEAQKASIRPCGKCGLSVSSTARFCRRCGAPQTLSA